VHIAGSEEVQRKRTFSNAGGLSAKRRTFSKGRGFSAKEADFQQRRTFSCTLEHMRKK